MVEDISWTWCIDKIYMAYKRWWWIAFRWYEDEFLCDARNSYWIDESDLKVLERFWLVLISRTAHLNFQIRHGGIQRLACFWRLEMFSRYLWSFRYFTERVFNFREVRRAGKLDKTTFGSTRLIFFQEEWIFLGRKLGCFYCYGFLIFVYLIN